MKEWLRLCDLSKCATLSTTCYIWHGSTQQPARLLDLGHKFSLDRLKQSNQNPTTIRLVSVETPVRYIALSHCWGQLSSEQTNQWLTTRDNLESRTNIGFPTDILPATFQDAITVTRRLGERYLWIDSLCILQGDKDDWESEAKKMGDVFRGAYCTIAATSSRDSTQGFLKRTDFSSIPWVRIPEQSRPPVFATTFINRFEEDVLYGPLNSRAWVFQERALSRRIIHFTDRQTYWECGGGVRCETLTYMHK